MTETQILLTYEPKEAIIRMVNDINQTNLKEFMFDFSEPSVINNNYTQIVLTPKNTNFPYINCPIEQPIVFNYYRVDLTEYLGQVLTTYYPPLPTSTQVILDFITQLTGQKFYQDDIVLEEIFVKNALPYLLKAKAESLRFVGEISLNLANLTNLTTFVNDNLNTQNEPRLGILYNNIIPFAPNIFYPFNNATEFKDQLNSLVSGNLVDSSLVNIINSVLPTPETLPLNSDNPWLINNSLNSFNLKNATVFDKGVYTSNTILNNQVNKNLTNFVKINLDPNKITNFDVNNTLPLTLSYRSSYSNSSFTTNPRFIQQGVTSASDGSNYNSWLVTLSKGNIITQQPYEEGLLIDGSVPWVVDSNGLSKTNLYGSLVQYNNLRRTQDPTPENVNLDRVLILSLSSYNSTYQGNLYFYYLSPIQLPLIIANGQVGVNATINMSVISGGTPPYLYGITSGSLCPGQSLNSNTGVIDGLPLISGTFTPTITVTDSNNLTVPFNYSYKVQGGSLQFSGDAPNGFRNINYFYSYNFKYGSPPYLFEIISGSLPNNIILNSSNGTLSGIPSTAGIFNWSIKITDSSNNQILINDGCSIT